MSLTLVHFTIGTHQCGLAVEAVEEVLRVVAVTPLPGAPAFVEGVINRRGVVTPVIDLRKRVGLAPGPFDEATRIVITTLRGHPAGLIVDAVSDVITIDEAGMGIDPTEVLGLDLRQYAARVVTAEGALVVVIDPACILTDEEGRQFGAAVPPQREADEHENDVA